MSIALPNEASINKPHRVYQFFDSDGHLLYVGCTSNIKSRLAYGHRGKSWWQDVASTVISEPMSRHDAIIVERTIIQEQAPLHNKQIHSPGVVRMLWRKDGKPANSPSEIFREPTREAYNPSAIKRAWHGAPADETSGGAS